MNLPSLRLPAEQFFWSVVDASVLPRANRSPPVEQLGYLFEQVLPLPIDQVHAVYMRIDRRKFLACGMDKHRLAEMVGGSEERCPLHLGPESIPDLGCDLAAVNIESINLLTGAFEPKPILRLKNRWLARMAALITLATMFGMLGFERRARQLDRQVAQIQDAQAETYRRVLGKQAMSTSAQPPSLQLMAQLRRLRQTRQSGAGVIGGGTGSPPKLIDCTQPFSSLLSIWPAASSETSSLFMQTESIVITPSALTVRGVVPNTADAEKLVAALTGPVLPGWQSQQPQVNAANSPAGGMGTGAVQVSLQWRSSPTIPNGSAAPAVVRAPEANP